MYEFYRLGSARPHVVVADVQENMNNLKILMDEAKEKEVSLSVFPELCITAYSCADLFLQTALIEASTNALEELQSYSKNSDNIFVFGSPLPHQNHLYNCAIVIQNGTILGVVPKSHLPNYKEFYEARWFKSGKNISDKMIEINEQVVPFGVDLLFKYDRYFNFGIEVCEDLWAVIPPSSYQALSGANILLNLSASNELVSKASYRNALVRAQSASCISAYVYSSAGVGESTTDQLFSGHCMISENGVMLAENRDFEDTNLLLSADVDTQRLMMTRQHEASFDDEMVKTFRTIKLKKPIQPKALARYVDAHPFVPKDESKRAERCEEIFAIQSSALAKRVKHIGSKRLVIGISGGLDSTLALLVCVETMKRLDRSNKDILAITMPGFGTTDQTYNNALELCSALDVELREINITKASLQHFEDISHDVNTHDVTYENTQARYRTQVLMDLANKEYGIVVGTGDLSEIALGWSTYNGDHMSMYAVNSSIPKTLISYMVEYVAHSSDARISKVLNDIVATPISPELLPKSKSGEIEQKTEDILGPYELHDFFLFHMMKYGASADKISMLAVLAFEDKYTQKKIDETLTLFIKRFFTQQFKRSAMPDGVKVGSISLSPRADLKMPSDASYQTWLKK